MKRGYQGSPSGPPQSRSKPNPEGDGVFLEDESTKIFARKVADHYSARTNQTLEEREASPIIHLKKLNNWIKSVLIQLYARPGNAVLDLACGKGGDLIKWDKAKIGYYVGIDIAEGSIEDCRTRYNGDADQNQRRKKFKFPARLLCGDCFEVRLDRALAEDGPFDLCSCQFALHYSWSTEARARRALANISALLRPGGILIGTMPDANVIVKKYREAEGLKFGNSVYWIRFDEDYADKKFKSSNPFGIRYKFHLEDAVDCPEWVVPFHVFKALAEEYDFELVFAKNNHQFVEEYLKKPEFVDQRNRWLEALEECEYLKKANPKLQLTAENLIDECASLQKFNWDLRRQNTDLHSRCTILESQLKDTQGKFSEFSVKIDTLEAEFLMIVEEVSLKEKTLKSELESLAIEDREQREKVMQENISLNDMYSEKVVEAENLQKELIHLIDQISVAHDKQETVSSEAILEVYVLRAEKAKLEASLKDLTSKYAITQRKLSIMEAEAEAKVQQLTGELTALRNNQDILMTKNDNLLVSQENLKIIEEKQRSVITGLEINLKASKYEELQLAEEISSLKEQLQRANLLQDEVLSLKTSLSEASFENQRVKASFDLLCKDHEDMKTEKDSLVEKINGMQQSLLELDNCQRSKIALEEKILRLEGDLATKEALYAQNAELRFELSKHKRANAELQRKIQHLEEDLEGYLNGVPVHQKPQQLKTTVMHDQLNSVGHADLGTECIDAVCSTKDEKQHLEILGVQSTDYLLKIQSLEIELAEALEANDMYKTQLRRFLSEEQTFSDTSMTAGSHNESDDRRQRNSISFLEVELRDIRERYLQLSLRYAEVEAQREELVLKLKSTNNTKSWFS